MTDYSDYVGLRQVFFDFEMTDLKARMGVMLVASFAEEDGQISTIVNTSKNVLNDKSISIKARDQLEKYNIIYGWNSKEHDVRFLNARLSYWGERPLSPDIFHVDLMWQFNKLKVGSRSLDSAAKFYGLDEQKLMLPYETWKQANIGDASAIGELVERCESDARLTREIARRVLPLVRRVGV